MWGAVHSLVVRHPALKRHWGPVVRTLRSNIHCLLNCIPVIMTMPQQRIPCAPQACTRELPRCWQRSCANNFSRHEPEIAAIWNSCGTDTL